MYPKSKPGAPAAVDVETGMPPGNKALSPLRAQQPLSRKHRQNLPGKELLEPRVIDPAISWKTPAAFKPPAVTRK
jgi:hypothetical protein